MKQTGFEQKVSMDHGEIILLSSKLRMNVRFWRAGGDEAFEVDEMPYLRGMALSNLNISGNKTEWEPPPYQVYNTDFRAISSARPNAWVVQEIVLEPTDDPLLFSVMPPRVRAEEVPLKVEWCWPLGAVTRQRSSEKISVTHFRYSMNVPILNDGSFFQSYPYTSRSGARLPLTEEKDGGNYRWLTHMEKDRYPQLVRFGQELADSVPDGDHLQIARSMEDWFQDTNRFTYTLDFRQVRRDPALDTVEDFVANHRSGYCEYYASALALMLRSQGIPSRMVTGFRGGDLNEFGQHLDVEQRHGHAWVEAYIRPEDCTQQMIDTGQADSQTGAWLRLDPTPAVDMSQDMLAGADDALGYAKSLWRDYVLGLQADRGATVVTDGGFKMAGILRVLDLGYWQDQITNLDEQLKERGGWKAMWVPLAALATVFTAIIVWWNSRNRNKGGQTVRRRSAGVKKGGWIRRSMAGILSAVSPSLGNWVIGNAEDSFEVPFYSNMVRTLSASGFDRQANQTQMEFATEVGQHLRSSDAMQAAADELSSIVDRVTRSFYEVRFGGQSLTEQRTTEIDQELGRLKAGLSNFKNTSGD